MPETTPTPGAMRALCLRQLRKANERRAIEWNGGNPAPLDFAMMELAGEVGEACNAAKKLARLRMGWPGGEDTTALLAEELADALICVDLAAMRAGIDLSDAVVRKFNRTSEKHGFETRLDPSRLIDAVMAEEREAVNTACVAMEIAILSGDKAWQPILDSIKASRVKGGA